MRSGYHIVDGSGIDFGNLGKVDGIYAKLMLAVSLNKPTYIANCVNGSNAFTPIPVYLSDTGTDVVISIGNMALHCSTSDVISVNAVNAKKK